jgi:intermembrane space import and assembly protein 40
MRRQITFSDHSAPPPAAGDLKDGPCGSNFVEAFSCFIRSDHEEKGMDCLPQFAAFQECLRGNPEHVDKIMQDADDALDAEETDAAESGAVGQQQDRNPP